MTRTAGKEKQNTAPAAKKAAHKPANKRIQKAAPTAQPPAEKQAPGGPTGKAKKRRPKGKAPKGIKGEQHPGAAVKAKGGAATKGKPSKDLKEELSDVPVDGTKPKRQDATVHVLFFGNLPFGATEKSVRQFLGAAGKEVSAIRLLTQKETNKARGCCFVEFRTSAGLQRALKYHGFLMDGRRIRIELSCGGGGNGASRSQKLQKKREKLKKWRTAEHQNVKARKALAAAEGGKSEPATDQ